MSLLASPSQSVRTFYLASAVSLAALLTGCLVPEKFTASATFAPDGSYRYQFAGTVVNALAVVEIQKNGKLSDKAKADFAKALDKDRQRPGIQKLEPINDTRYTLQYDGDRKLTDSNNNSPFFVFRVSSKDWTTSRTLTVTGPQIKPKDKKELDALNIKPNGTVSLILPANAKVIKHNASSTPGLLSKAYSWNITSLSDQPSIEFQLPQ